CISQGRGFQQSQGLPKAATQASTPYQMRRWIGSLAAQRNSRPSLLITAMSQLCAFSSPKSGSKRDIAMFHQRSDCLRKYNSRCGENDEEYRGCASFDLLDEPCRRWPSCQRGRNTRLSVSRGFVLGTTVDRDLRQGKTPQNRE